MDLGFIPECNSLSYFCIDIPQPWKKVSKRLRKFDFVKYEKELYQKDQQIRAAEIQKEKMMKEKKIEEEKRKKLLELKKKSNISPEEEEVREFREKVISKLGYQNLESILKKIPGFDFRFTEEQLKMINSTPKRMVIIGR